MLKNILKLGGVQKLTTKQQKKATGGGGGYYDYGLERMVNEDEDTTTGPTPLWKYRCYSSGTASYNTPQYFMSLTYLGYPYICHKR